MKRAERNHQPQKQEAQIKTLKVQEPESSDEYELVDQDEVPQETTQEVEDEAKKSDAAKREEKAKDTLMTPKEFVKAAKEDEDFFEGQQQDIAFMIEDLDEKRLEELLQSF